MTTTPCLSCDGTGILEYDEDSWTKPRMCGGCNGSGQIDAKCTCVFTDAGASPDPDCVVHG